MTIAAGFVVRDGVLLCADTLHTDGHVKEYRDKLYQWTGRNTAVAFACAGNTANALEVVEKCKDALANSRRRLSAAVVRSLVRPIVRKVYIDVVCCLPPDALDNATFSLLFCVCAKGERPTLFQSLGTAVLPVPEFTCAGNGYDVGKHIIGLAYRPTMTIDEVSMLAILALGATKEIIDGIGGRSQFLAMRRNTLVPIVPHDVNVSEPLALQYQREALALFLALGKGLSREDLRKRVATFTDRVLTLGEQWSEQAAPWVELCASLSGSTPQS